MNLTKPTASLVSVVLLTLGMATLVTSPASARTDAVSATCSALAVDLRYSAASRDGSPAQGCTEYEWTRTVVDQAAWTEYVRYTCTPERDGAADPADVSSNPLTDPGRWNADHKGDDNGAVDTCTHSGSRRGSWFWWVATTHEATTNHVVVTIDGTTVEDTDVTTTFTKSYALSDTCTSHTCSVVVTAWDDPAGSHGWSFTRSGSSIACTPPVIQVTAVFPEHIAPTCTTDGSLPSLPSDQTGIAFSWDVSNPLTTVATAESGDVLTGVKDPICAAS